jgi:outer membrane protein assembly factor BamB
MRTTIAGAFALVAAAAGAIALATARAAPPDGIAMFRGEPEHTGRYSGPEIAQFGGLQWRVQTGGMVQASVTVAGGVAYVGSGDGNLYALDAATGEERWRFAAGRAISATPAVANGLVFVTSRDSVLWAIDAGSGRRWRRRPARPPAPLGLRA